MNEQAFLLAIRDRSQALQVNPLLLLSGIEGLYTFRDQPIDGLNYNFLDSLILTIFALRIGDGFHSLAEEQLSSGQPEVQLAAIGELTELNAATIAASGNVLLQSFAKLLDGKSPIRQYHVKALEVAAVEINRTQQAYNHNSIGAIVLHLCQHQLKDVVDLGTIFNG